MMGELLSGSQPPAEFFNPLNILFQVCLYGAGAFLIREARVKWNLQWSIVFLAIAYGIVEEGLMVKSFFNTNWIDMGPLAGYGMLWGVQWVWTIWLIVYHAVMSILIPITITDLLWPEYKFVRLSGKKGITLAFVALTLITLLGLIFFGTHEGGVVTNKMIPFYPAPILLIGSFLAVLVLVWLAHVFRRSRIESGSRPFGQKTLGFIGFLFMGAAFFLPIFLASTHPSVGIAVSSQMILIILGALFIYFQIANQNLTIRHLTASISGVVSFFAFLAILQGFKDRSMFFVGVAALILLALWRHRVLKKDKEYEKIS